LWCWANLLTHSNLMMMIYDDYIPILFSEICQPHNDYSWIKLAVNCSNFWGKKKLSSLTIRYRAHVSISWTNVSISETVMKTLAFNPTQWNTSARAFFNYINGEGHAKPEVPIVPPPPINHLVFLSLPQWKTQFSKI
jgi:hypothetical protein